MGQPRRGACLAEESLANDIAADEIRQHLDRHETIEADVAAGVDHAHASAPNLLE
jgi:hypothetical protein